MSLQATKKELDTLLAIQEIDKQIIKLNSKINLQNQDKENQSNKIINELENKIAVQSSLLGDFLEKNTKNEADLNAISAQLTKKEKDLDSIKNQKESQAILNEIQNITAVKNKLLDQISQDQAQIKIVQESIEKGKNEFKKEQKIVKQNSKEAQENTQILKNETDVLVEKREKYSKNISSELLNRYKNIKEYANGVGIAVVAGKCCSACGYELTPYYYSKIQNMKNEILGNSIQEQGLISYSVQFCEECERILVFW